MCWVCRESRELDQTKDARKKSMLDKMYGVELQPAKVQELLNQVNDQMLSMKWTIYMR